MNDSPFYVTLPSDASMEQYPFNSAADWTTKLKHPVTLKGKWEVALVELQYMNSLSTLSKSQRMIIRIITEVKQNGAFKTTDHEIIFPPGHYGSADAFTTIIRNNIPTLAKLIIDEAGELEETSFLQKEAALHTDVLSPTDHRLRITLASPRVHIFFPPDSITLQKILGFDHSDIYAGLTADRNDSRVQEIANMYVANLRSTSTTVPIIAPRPLNPMLGNQSLFVYCDVADYSLMGDSAAQILRTTSIRGSFMELITERFDVPHYVPVLTNHFEKVNVSISTDLEETARFATGKSLVKLHFHPHCNF